MSKANQWKHKKQVGESDLPFFCTPGRRMKDECTGDWSERTDR